MDPKEYRRTFRDVLGFLRNVEKSFGGGASGLLSRMEVAYDAERDATEALEAEVSRLTKELHKSQVRIAAYRAEETLRER
ncbi:MAG: hypothetical protein ACYDH4_09550 [Candidatus Cryosericum sp.]